MKVQKKKGKKEEKPLKIKGSLNEVLRIAVGDNPKPQKQAKKKQS